MMFILFFMRIQVVFTSIDTFRDMKHWVIYIFSVVTLCQSLFAQTGYVVSCPAEIKMVGLQSHYLISKKSFLLHYHSTETFIMVVNLNEFTSIDGGIMPGDEIKSQVNVKDTNNLIFKAQIKSEKIRPKENLKDTYTFSVNGEATFKNQKFYTQIICSYGDRMLNNISQSALNIHMELLKMDQPIFINAINEYIDNLSIVITNGTVNLNQE